jgi:hypothetical protein
VINAAVRGYLGVQEMLYYWSRVEAFRPDVVISFSGPVDAGYAEFVGEQDQSQPLKTLRHIRIERQVTGLIQNSGGLKDYGLQALLRELVKRTNIARALKKLSTKYFRPPAERDIDQRKKEFQQPLNTQWAKVRAHTYIEVMQDFKSLANRRGATFMTIFPPLLFDQKPISDKEKKCIVAVNHEISELAVRKNRYRPYAGIIREAIRDHPFMHDLSGIFANETAPMYVDAGHFNAAGQHRVGTAIAGLILENKEIRRQIGR